MCGEHPSSLRLSSDGTGSSPHVRGALRGDEHHDHVDGIIPACAGSTLALLLSSSAIWDHPRMCGEHTCSASADRAVKGSSPHVRGAQHADWDDPLKLGIIPACAGSTPFLPFSSTVFRDHPRMCGEHLEAFDFSVAQRGSSPHVRGARLLTCAYA